VTQLV